jgi:hypothetical protein
MTLRRRILFGEDLMIIDIGDDVHVRLPLAEVRPR